MEKVEKVKSRWRKSYFDEANSQDGFKNVITSGNGTTDNHHHHHHHSARNYNDNNHHHRHHHKSNNHHHNHHHHKQPQYEPITENLYLDKQNDYSAKARKEAKSMDCDCILTPEERARGVRGCSDYCLNRMVMIECTSNCTLGEFCLNKRFQNKENAPVEVFKTKKKGFGLRATAELPPQTFIMEYVGEVVRSKEFRNRVKKYTKQKIKHHYFMALRSDEIIDATVKGNLTRFINHSCEPNCETQKWTVNGELRIGFFTIQTLQPGEEVTFDYQFQRYGRKAQKCYCKAPSCRGFIGGESKKFSLNGELSPHLKESNDDDEGLENNESKALNLNLIPGFKIPKLNRQQRIEIEKKMDEEAQKEEAVNKLLLARRNGFKTMSYEERRLSLLRNQSFNKQGLVNSALGGIVAGSSAALAPTTNGTAIKRRNDFNQAINNIELTPAPKLSKEEHRQKFELTVKLKDFYDTYEKVHGPAAVEQLKTHRAFIPLITDLNPSMDEALASSVCGTDDEYYKKRDNLPTIDIVMNESYPHPGSYYTTPNGEHFFATVLLNRHTQTPQTVILSLPDRPFSF